MSHVVTVKLEIKDVEALRAACNRIDGAELVNNGDLMDLGMYTRGSEKQGIGLQLEGWNNHVMIVPETGEVRYDNYNGRWGAQEKLDELVQAYSVEKVKLEAMMHGHVVTEEYQENGDIKWKVQDFSS